MKNTNLLKITSIILLFCITFSFFSLFATAIESPSDASPVENTEKAVVDNSLKETSGTYMYFIDPATLTYCLQDGSSGGSDCGQITTYLEAHKRYYIVAATDNISSQTGELYLIFKKV